MVILRITQENGQKDLEIICLRKNTQVKVKSLCKAK
jgi:hypothetical protein